MSEKTLQQKLEELESTILDVARSSHNAVVRDRLRKAATYVGEAIEYILKT